MNKTKELTQNALILTICLFISLLTSEIPFLLNFSAPILLLTSKKLPIKASITSYILFSFLNFILKGAIIIYILIYLLDIVYATILILIIHRYQKTDWLVVILTHFCINYYALVSYLVIFLNLTPLFISTYRVISGNPLLILIEIVNLFIPNFIAFLIIYCMSKKTSKIITRLENVLY